MHDYNRWAQEWVFSVGLMALLAGCSDIELADGIYGCSANVPGACPEGWYCRPVPGYGEYRCFSTTGGDCGDGVVEGVEVCDGTQLGDATCEAVGYGAGEISCDDVCELDLSGCTDPFCELTCIGEGDICVGRDAAHSSCAVECAADATCDDDGFTCCMGGCVDLQSDPNNCGACGVPCQGDCVNGACGDACGGQCVAPQECCAGSCVDTSTSLANCGTCGSACDLEKANACVGSICKCGSTSVCTGTDMCVQYSGLCVPEGGCTDDEDCNPPSTICEGYDCVAGCTEGSCGTGNQCNLTTGRCEPPSLLPDGGDCTATGSSGCQSGFCMALQIYHNPNWVTFNVCSRVCCTETDCELGFACLYNEGVKMCIPDSIYPPGFTFTQSAGEVCGPTGPYCRSGFCNSAFNTCAPTCCESSQCGGDACVWYEDTAVGYMFEMCVDASGLPVAPTGTACSATLDCTSMVCNANQCADLCCSNLDCPMGYRCAQVLGQSTTPTATTACVLGNPGTGADGSGCTVGAAPSPQCQSGLCADGICRSPCCSDTDCVTPAACLPVPSGVDINSDGVSDFVRACIL